MLTHLADDFSLVIPKRTGVTWQNQTAGVFCHQVYIEGVMIPLDRPRDIINGKVVDYLSLLMEANYNHNHKSARRLWEKINGSLEFKYEIVKEPKGQPHSQEGLEWIRITKIKYPKKKDWLVKRLDEEFKDLVGKRVALLYPNSD